MRRTIRRENGGVALFPFLAVLICTMGSLIVLLVLLVQQAHVDAHSLRQANAAATANPVADPLRQQLEDANFRRELLEQSRTETAAQLADGRAKLAHLEDHLLRLEARARELIERAKSIDEGRQLKDDGRAAAAAELQKLQDEIAKKQAQLEEAKRKQADAEHWFALIPYEGPNHTRRRPIYIECTAQGIILQPEGIVLQAADFDGPLGPGNPLDAALRTVREHISQTTGNAAGEPYPLLVVRPSGVVAYGTARAALKSWDDEFGYELVEDDKQLVFGDPDPALFGALKKSVSIARQRQAAMVAMMPRRYANDQPLTSFAPEDALRGSGFEPGAMRSGRGVGSGEGGYGSGLGGAPGGSGFAPGAGRGADVANLAGGAEFTNPGGASSGGTGQPGGQPGGGSAGPYSPGNMGQFAAPFGSPSGGQTAGQGSSAQGQAGQAGQGTSAQPSLNAATGTNSSQGGNSTGSSASGQNSGQFSASGSPAMGQPSPSGGAAQSGNSSAQSGSGGKSPRAGSGAGRGSNWALPGANRHSTAITRPIYVAAMPDRLVLLPERGDNRPPQTIRVAPEMTAQQVDAFVSAVQREMKGWGLAVQDGYWKPVLQIEVAPGAEHQYQTLRSALENSGFDVHRKQMP
jgi:hypothetical protein